MSNFTPTKYLPNNLNIELDKNDALPLLQAKTILPATNSQRILIRGPVISSLNFEITYGNDRIGGRNRSILKHTISEFPSDFKQSELVITAQIDRQLLLEATISWSWASEPNFVRKIDLNTLKTLPEYDELDVYQELVLTQKQIDEGCTLSIDVPNYELCNGCAGKGLIGSPTLCPKCKGKGKLNKGVLAELFNTNHCNRCNGSGILAEIDCTQCKGLGYVKRSQRVKVVVPNHLGNGKRITLRALGKPGLNGLKGDLHLVAKISAT